MGVLIHWTYLSHLIQCHSEKESGPYIKKRGLVVNALKRKKDLMMAFLKTQSHVSFAQSIPMTKRNVLDTAQLIASGKKDLCLQIQKKSIEKYYEENKNQFDDDDPRQGTHCWYSRVIAYFERTKKKDLAENFFMELQDEIIPKILNHENIDL